ncbi:beta-galactosidase, partial [bacterium]|nr:beta-galactosidase [bacterium]
MRPASRSLDFVSRSLRLICVHLCLSVVPFSAPAALAQDAEELELDHTLSMEFETPHIQWAKPYARGRLRVLFFCNGRGTIPREAVELKQRFDFDIDAVFWRRIVDSTKEGWHGGDLGLQRMLRLAAKPYDCYVFFGIRPNQLTAEMQFKCLQPIVEAGKGVVLVGVSDPRILKPARRIGAPPPFIAQARPQAVHAVGKGRGVQLPARPDVPYDFGWRLLYEQWQARLGRSILWAAGREPQVSISPNGQWKNPTKRKLTYTGVLHYPDGRSGAVVRFQSAEPEGRLSLAEALGKTHCGTHLLSVLAHDDGGIHGWTARQITIEQRPALAVRELTLERGWGKVGERIKGAVQLANPAGAAAARVVVRLRDRRERVLAQQAITDWNAGTFDLPIEPWMPMLLRVEALVLDKAGVARGRASTYFRVTQRHRDQFNFLMWDTPKGPTAPHAIESLSRLGVTLTLGHGNPDRALAAYDIAWVPYTTRILEGHTQQGVMKPHCWNDAPAVARYVASRAETHRESRQHGVYVYSLGDENHVRGSCASPHCLAAYRRYLKEVYGDTKALNASWGSACKSFDDVQLLQPDDNEAAEAKRKKNYPRWYDRQAFRSWNYVQYCKAYAAAYKAIDPQALTGFEGAGRFERGDDIDLFVRELGFWSPYPGTDDEVLRSIAPK